MAAQGRARALARACLPWQAMISPHARSLAASVSEHMSTILTERGVVRVKGADALHFLQGLVTNDVTHLAEGRPLFAAMLSPQGRLLLDLHLHQAGPEEVLLDVCAARREALIKSLNRYRLRSRVFVDDVSDALSVAVEFSPVRAEDLASRAERGASTEDLQSSPGSPSSSPSSGPAPSLPPGASVAAGGHVGPVPGSRGQEVASSSGLPSDPRLATLGFRGLVRAGQWAAGDEGAREAYRALRLSEGVLEGSTEIPPESSLALECNLDGLHGVSFQKGCYVGQEMTARSHFVLVVRKRAMPLFMRGPSPAEALALARQSPDAGLPVRAEGQRRPLGILRACATLEEGIHVGAGVMRVAPALRPGGAVAVEGWKGEVQAVRPGWWPDEWGREEGEGET